MARKTAAAKVLEELAAKAGGTIDLSVLTRLNQKPKEEVVREAESVLRSLHKPHEYMMKTCKRAECGQVFKTNYCSMAYCSDACLAHDMRDIGIIWSFKDRTESQMYGSDSLTKWRYEPPEYISTDTLNQLEGVFRTFLTDLDRLRAHAEDVENQRRQEMIATPLGDWDSEDELPEVFGVNLPEQRVLVLPAVEPELTYPSEEANLPEPLAPLNVDWFA